MSIQHFEILNKLGEGAFSNVFKVRRKADGQIYAMKRVKFTSLSQREKENALNEIRILASIEHPNIIAYKEAFFDDATRSLCIIMEHAEDGDLGSKIAEYRRTARRFSASSIWNVLIQLVTGLQVLHRQRIVHRDLKVSFRQPANIFISSSGHVKIGDLNVSKVMKQGLVYTQTGTPYYASPEVWGDRPYSCSSDIWSLGCVLYEMAALAPPFEARDMQDLYRKVMRGVFKDLPSCYPHELNVIVRRMIQLSPSTRPSCDKILSYEPVRQNTSTFHMANQGSSNLLDTIAFSENPRVLRVGLPKPAYARRMQSPVNYRPYADGRMPRSTSVEKVARINRRALGVIQDVNYRR